MESVFQSLHSEGVGAEVKHIHKSIEALRIYERPGEREDRDACNALADISNLTAIAPHSRSTNSQPIVTHPSSVRFRDMRSAFNTVTLAQRLCLPARSFP